MLLGNLVISYIYSFINRHSYVFNRKLSIYWLKYAFNTYMDYILMKYTSRIDLMY